ncbi:MAG TPA: oligosaccharide flippase family protein, partial [bacterium]|nr:oligosaccharide flippase family protein [bacterium]
MQPSDPPPKGLRRWFLSTDRLATSVGIVLFLMVCERVFWIARGIIFPRVLGPAEYGIYTLGLFPVPLLTALVGLGVPSAFGRYLSRHAAGGTLRWYLKRTYLLPIALSIVTTAIVLARPSFFSKLIFGDPSHGLVIALAAISVPVLVLVRNLSTTFMGLKLFRAGRLVESSQVILYAVIGIPLILYSRTAAAGALGYGVSAAASVAIFAPLL